MTSGEHDKTDDFRYSLVAPANNQAGCVSIRSHNWPNRHVCVCDPTGGTSVGGCACNGGTNSLEVGRLGIAELNSNNADACSWKIVPGLADPTNASLKSLISMSSQFKNAYMSLDGELIGGAYCHGDFSSYSSSTDVALNLNPPAKNATFMFIDYPE